MTNQEIEDVLSDFENVWQRVSAANPVAPEEQTLREFIDDETCDTAYYSSLSRMFQGPDRAMLLSHAADEKNHARRLRAEYFIRTGESYTPGGVCEPITGKMASLRTSLQHEQAGAAAYRNAAEQTTDPELRELYLRHAADEDRHALENRTMILNNF